MTLLDASIIIDALRTKDVQLMRSMLAVDGAVCGVSRAEVLSGSRGPRDRATLVANLDGVQQVTIPSIMWDEVGLVQSELRANGLTVPLADAVLSTVALSLDVAIWARDAHFIQAQQILPTLKLYRETT